MRPTPKHFVVLLLMLSCATMAHAELPSDGLLNDITQKFFDQSAAWERTIVGAASWVFWTLTAISMVWTFGMMAFRKADIAEFFMEFIKFTITTGFFWWLLYNGPKIAKAIIDSLRQIGATAGGVSQTLSASTPISIAFDIVKKGLSSLSLAHPIEGLGSVVIICIIVICLTAVAANILLALVNAWILMYAGSFILGFGGSRWTSDMAIGYYKSMLAAGLELMTITLMVGIGTSVVDSIYTAMDGSSLYDLLIVMCVCAVLAFLIDKVPGRVAALAHGGHGAHGGGGGGGASFGAGAVMGAAAMGGAAIASAGTSAAGGAQAIKAAISAAMADVASGNSGGAGLASSASASKGDDSGGTEGQSPLASAMGDSSGPSPTSSANKSDGQSARSADSKQDATTDAKAGEAEKSNQGQPQEAQNQKSSLLSQAGQVAAGTAKHLAQGAANVARDRFAESTAMTLGGKVASAIKSNSNSGGTFNGNSLSGASPEVDEFVNKGKNT